MMLTTDVTEAMYGSPMRIQSGCLIVISIGDSRYEGECLNFESQQPPMGLVNR